MPTWVGVYAFVGALACAQEPSSWDLEGPSIVDANVSRRAVEWPVAAPMRLGFSEPIDRDSIEGAVALVPWETVGDCSRTPLCVQGSCQRGRCQIDPVTASDLSALEDGRGVGEDSVPFTWALEGGPGGPDTILWITPVRALSPRHRYALVVGSAVRDAHGNPLVDEMGGQTAWRADLVTADEGSSGPEARLVRPAAGTGAVPVNVATVRVRYAVPVRAEAGDRLWLERDDGGAVALYEPRPCPGWVSGMCLDWSLDSMLEAGRRYRPDRADTLDVHGRPSVRPPADEVRWFEVGGELDEVSPELTAAAEVSSGCLRVRTQVSEPVRLELEVLGAVTSAEVSTEGTLALPLPQDVVGPVPWELRAEDLAGNTRAWFGEAAFEAGSSPFSDLIITEVLANPAGAEPGHEFVELWRAVGGENDRTYQGLHLADLGAAEVQAALAAGDFPGDVLAPFTLAPGMGAIVVASGYHEGEFEDPRPPAGTIVVEVDGSLANGGLKNAGEPLTLYDAQGGIVSTYGDHVDPSGPTHDGVSVVRVDPLGCDVAANWRSHPDRTSSPGRLP